jgi:hypothetical protein
LVGFAGGEEVLGRRGVEGEVHLEMATGLAQA